MPSIASINPQNIPAGGADFGVTVTGTGFVSTSVVRWNGADRFTFVANNTQLSATMHASDIASPGSAQITVFNSSPGGGTSGSATFTITPTTNAVPALTSFSPSPVFAGGVTFALTVHGSNFLSGSRVELDGSPLVTTFVSTIQLQATVNDFSILSPRTAHLDVVNGPPGGGTSAVLPVSIVPGGTPAGVIDIASVATDGTQGNKDSFHPSMSPDGRFIAFESRAFNLAPGATGGHSEIYVRDTCFGVSASCIPSTTMISVAPDGSEANSDCLFPSLSGGGRFVAFESGATNLVSGANNGLIQVLLHDRDIGGSGVLDQPGNTTNVLVSIGTDGNPANTGAGQASLNADGRFVAFESGSDNLVSNDTNSSADVFVRDTCAAAPAGCAPRTVRASMATDGTQTGAGSYSGNPSISADGRFVAFESSSGNLVPGFDRGGVFLRDTCLSVPVGCIPSTIGISIDGAGGPAFGAFASMSADARFVTFVSSGLIAGDTAGQDVYVRDTCQGAPLGCKPTTAQASIGKGGIQSNGSSDVPSISADGRFVGFQSAATNLAENNPNDTNGDPDFFVYDTCFGAPTACVPKTFQVSMANDGTQGQGDNGVDYPSIRVGMNGSVVIFRSSAPNLLPSLAHRQSDIFRVITSF